VTADPKTIPSASISEANPAKDENRTPDSKTPAPGSRTRIWLLRLRALLLVTLCATFGVLLIILPWTPRWTDNPVLLTWPALRRVVASGFFRGVCSGLGIVDLWLGFSEAIHYHETPVNRE
jgi:hypothetical protein